MWDPLWKPNQKENKRLQVGRGRKMQSYNRWANEQWNTWAGAWDIWATVSLALAMQQLHSWISANVKKFANIFQHESNVRCLHTGCIASFKAYGLNEAIIASLSMLAQPVKCNEPRQTTTQQNPERQAQLAAHPFGILYLSLSLSPAAILFIKVKGSAWCVCVRVVGFIKFTAMPPWR